MKEGLTIAACMALVFFGLQLNALALEPGGGNLLIVIGSVWFGYALRAGSH